MNIQASKIELVKLILNIENSSIINKILDILKNDTTDFYLELSESEKEEINLGIQQLDNGERISLEDFMKKVS
ncbi:MAG: hypothetical protein ACK5B9_08185 [Flavobacteriia bacterium]|jgi:hypothetical protein